MLKFALPPTQILKFALSPMRNPNASQWNIGCLGSQTQISHIGHVHFMFFGSISFTFGSQREPSFWWNMGFTVHSSISQIEHILKLRFYFSLIASKPKSLILNHCTSGTVVTHVHTLSWHCLKQMPGLPELVKVLLRQGTSVH